MSGSGRTCCCSTSRCRTGTGAAAAAGGGGGVRRRRDVPVIMLTARGTETDKIVGLEIGADDYVVKPFSGAEVIARIRAVLRRTRGTGDTTPAGPVAIGALVVDLAGRRATMHGQSLELSRKEFDLLAELVRNAGRVV